MIRILAKLWNRRYLVLSIAVVLLVAVFLLPGKADKQTDSLENSTLTEVENPILTMYANTDVVLYAKPKDDAKEVSTVAEGTAIVDLKPAKDGWYSTKYNNEKVYVQSKFLVEEYIIPTEAPTEPPTEPPFEPHWSDDGKWLIVDEEVRAEGNVWLRDKPGGEKLLLIENNDKLHRTQIGVNGWSFVKGPDGETEGYISTFYLQPTERVTYEEVQEYVIVTEDARVRSSGSINSDQIGWAIKGDEYVRIGVSQHGWSQILYKGKVQYIFSNYIQKIEKTVDPADLGNYVPPSQGGTID